MPTARGRYCIGCGFDLTGIVGVPARCPECGREFDPSDAGTYDVWPRRARRARLLRRVGVGLVVLGLAIALFPRGWAVARLTIRAPGQPSVEAVRTELIAPGWLSAVGVRYPRWTREGESASATGKAVEFEARCTALTLRGRRPRGGVMATADADEMANLVINGVPAEIGRAGELFETVVPNMVAERSYGVSVGQAGTPVAPPPRGVGAGKK